MKLDQAQYRELEAFSKFGSDLDTATKNILDKGAKNVEILKQGLHAPMSVEKQIAIIYAGTKGLLKEVPLNKVKSFESEYLTQLETRFPNVLAELKAGKLTDEVEKTLVEVSKEVSLLYK